MKITKSYLKQVIKEELENMQEADAPMGRRGIMYKDVGGGVKLHTGEKMPGAETLLSTSVQELRQLIQDIAKESPLPRSLESRLLQIASNLESMEPTPPLGQVD